MLMPAQGEEVEVSAGLFLNNGWAATNLSYLSENADVIFLPSRNHYCPVAVLLHPIPSLSWPLTLLVY